MGPVPLPDILDLELDLDEHLEHLVLDETDDEDEPVLRWRDGKVIAGRGAIFGDGTAEYDHFWSPLPVKGQTESQKEALDKAADDVFKGR